MEERSETESKFERIKEHVKRNKKTYIASAITAVVVATVTIIVMKKHEKKVNTDTTLIVENKGGLGIIECETNLGQIVQVISKYGNKLGRPGKPVYDTSDNMKLYQSRTLAALAAGGTDQMMSRHMRGLLPDVNGHVFMEA